MHRAHDLDTRWPALGVAARRAHLQPSFRFAPGPLSGAVADHREPAARAAAGLFRRDTAIWSRDALVQRTIANRLGWLGSPRAMADSIGRLQTFAAGIRRDGFEHVVLLGMGGSSLAPEVLRAVIGVAPGFPRLQVLDSTDPAAVRAAATPPAKTLYVLASKSGTTIEPNSMAAHFRGVLESAGVPAWGDRFVAITDEGTALAARARSERFREVFINPSDIGGRYSAISYFGLVPAALMGQDVNALVGWAMAMLDAAGPDSPEAPDNPAVGLGLAIAASARAGRDKLSLLLPPALESLGLWIEQLVAESTGKEGVGIVPIAGEPFSNPTSYGADRMFVDVRLGGRAADGVSPERLDALASVAPIATLNVSEPVALGAEFVRWEIATAIAGALLGINPFDEPNVQQAKDATRALLTRHQAEGRLPVSDPDALVDGVAITATAAARRELKEAAATAVLSLLRPGDYLGLLAFVGPDEALASTLSQFRMAVHARSGAATMLGYGPRYLHSTGQLHKGGPNSGLFVLVTAAPEADLPIPGEPFSFGTLELAQALGDFQSLDATGRRAVHVHLPSPDARRLRKVLDALLTGLAPA